VVTYLSKNSLSYDLVEKNAIFIDDDLK
jgi:hypothetical protein